MVVGSGLASGLSLDDYTDDEIVLPAQFAGPRFLLSPEKHLLYAILHDAVICVQDGQRRGARPRVQKRAQEALAWFNSNEQKWLCSFLRICDALHLDPDWIRAHLNAIPRRRRLVPSRTGKRRRDET